VCDWKIEEKEDEEEERGGGMVMKQADLPLGMKYGHHRAQLSSLAFTTAFTY